MDKFVPNGKDLTIGTFFKPVGKSFVPYFGSENRVLFQSVCPCNEFEGFNIVLVIILISEVNFLVGKFLEVFNYSYISKIVIENFEKRKDGGRSSK